MEKLRLASLLLLRLFAGLDPAHIFFPGGHAAANVALGFVDVQHHTGPGCQGGIYLLQPVGYICWCPIRNKKI